MKEEIYPLNTHMHGWYISKRICTDLIKYFHTCEHHHREGQVSGGVVKKDTKESTDLRIDASNMEGVIGRYRDALQDCLDLYINKHDFLNYLARFNVVENIAIQYYKKNQGFKIYHTENTDKQSSNRVMVFMTFLNDVPDGGTEFMYQNITVPAKKGLTLIWPASYTHVHRGQISKNFEKYIITGWFSYE